MSEWISVTERLPEVKENYRGGPKQARVLIFTGHYVCEGMLEETYIRRNLTWKNARDRCVGVTHWMPLPEGPRVSPEESMMPIGLNQREGEQRAKACQQEGK